jgi:hypothetical protein
MNNKKTTTKPKLASERDKKITAESLQVIMKEFDTMKNLFSETQASIQSIFNFYITLVTAVIGGIALVLQFPANTSADIVRSQVIIFGLLILASIIGTIYLLSIVQRYSRLIEYGQNLDALRLHLIQELDVPMPPIYSHFIEQTTKQITSSARSPFLWIAWMLPTGTYQLAMAFINSFALSTATWILLSISGATSMRFYDSLITVIIEFFLILNIYNIYSQVALKHWASSFRLYLDPHVESPFRMIR